MVVLRGAIDLYRPKGEIGFILSELDVTALLGRLAAERAELLRALDAEGLLRRNREVPVPEVPLRVGLVASPDTEGYRDFLGRLTGSPFGFVVKVAPVRVQGGEAPRAIAHAVNFVGSKRLRRHRGDSWRRFEGGSGRIRRRSGGPGDRGVTQTRVDRHWAHR